MIRNTATVVCTVLAAVAACVDPVERESTEMPPVVEVFACSDNCPGPRERYIKRVYEGVTDEEECRRLGGRPYTVTGWVERTICEVP